MPRFHLNRLIPPVLVAGALVAAGSTAHAADAKRQIDRTFTPAAGSTFSLLNLAGDVTLSRASGSELKVSATVHAQADTQAEAERLADLLSLAVDESGTKVAVKAAYPLAKYRKYAYPRQADSIDVPWFLEWLKGLSSVSSDYDGVQVRVVSARSSSAPALFVDFRLEIPAGVAVSVDNLIGELEANGVAGDLTMELSSGVIETRSGVGALSVETGSGDIVVLDQQGMVSTETGSGDIQLDRVQGERVAIETGSGDVRLNDVAAALSVETGSGDILADRLVAGDRLSAETGSGDIELSGDFARVTELAISTGSGDVKLTAVRTPQVQLAVSTGSGDITVDLPLTRITRSGGNALTAAIGSAAGSGSITTGSGDVSLLATP